MKTPLCPFIKKACMEHECMLYTHVQMTDPQSGLAKDEWACSLALIPIMVIEGARCTRGVQAAVESTRNEIVQRQDTLNAAIDAASQGRLGVDHEVRIAGSGSSPRLLDGGGGTDVDRSESLNGTGGE